MTIWPAATLARLRQDNQTIKTYLAIEQPRSVFTARVSGSPSPGDISVPYTSGVETETTRLNYTLWVSSIGYNRRDKGAVRLRAVYPDHFEVSFNHIDWDAGDYVTVVNQIRPWTSFAQGQIEEGTFQYEDQNAEVGTYNDSFPPQGRIGPSAAVAFIEADGKARLKFYQDSTSVEGLTLTHAWEFEQGTPATSSAEATSTDPLLVTWSTPGQYLVHYTVTDTASHTHERWCRVFIFTRDEANGPITDMAVESLSGSYEDGGWSLSGKLYGATSGYIEGAMVVAFTEQFWGSELFNIGHPLDWQFRDNIIFVGWVHKSRTTVRPGLSIVNFEAYGPAGWMKESASWPSDIKDNGGTGWHFIPNATPDKVFLHLLWWHTNMNLLADCYTTETTLALKYVQIQEGNLYTQIDQQTYDSLKGRLVANRFGQLRAERNPQLIPTASRWWVWDWANITMEDSREEINLGDDLDNPRVAQVDYTGFYYDGDGNPHGWSSFAPARELSTGSIERITGTRVLSQLEANELAGLHLAHANNVYNDVEFPWRGFAPFDIIPSRRLYLTLSPSENYRGLSWTNKAFFVRGVTHEFNEGSVLTTLKLEAESSGPPGVTHIVPDTVPTASDPVEPTTPDPPEVSVPTVPPSPPPVEGTVLWEVEETFGTMVTSSDVNSTGLILCGWRFDSATASYLNRVECRDVTDGSIIWATEVDAYNAISEPEIVADDDFIYMIYMRDHSYSTVSTAGRLLKIDATDGSVDLDVTAAGGYGAELRGLTHDATHVYYVNQGRICKNAKSNLGLTFYSYPGANAAAPRYLARSSSYLMGGYGSYPRTYNASTGLVTDYWTGAQSQQATWFNMRILGTAAYFFGRRLLTGEKVAQLEKWDITTNTRAYVAKGVNDGAGAYCYGDLETNRAVLGGEFLAFTIWNLSTGELIFDTMFSSAAGDVIKTIAISGDYAYGAGSKNGHWYLTRVQLDNA